MTLHNPIIGLRNIHVSSFNECKNGQVLYFAKYKPRHRKHSCAHCESFKTRSKGWRERSLKHTRTGNKTIIIRLQIRKLFCHSCKRSCHQRIEDVRPRMRSTENYRMEVYEQHLGGVSQTTIAKTHQISPATVERWYKDFLGFRAKEMKQIHCPFILGIDEHHFTKKMGYATTMVDLRNHKVFDVVLGRSEASLASYFRRLKGKDKVKVVVMDLSSTYRAIARKHFPNAMIVADRFHVVRLIQQQFQKTWSKLDPMGRRNRGLLSLFRRNRTKCTPKQQGLLDAYLKSVPGLEICDLVQQELLYIVRQKQLSRKSTKQLLPVFLRIIDELQNSAFEELKTLGNTLWSWKEEIGRMLRFTKNNSITEGFHTKMEMISRRAFGFRNFQNYRLRVLALCGNDGLFNRVEIGR